MTGSPSDLLVSCRLAETRAALKNCLSISGVRPTPMGRLPTWILRARRERPMWFWASAAPAPAAPGVSAVCMLIAASAAPERPEAHGAGPTPAAESVAASAGLAPIAARLLPCMPRRPAVELGTLDEVTTDEMDCGMSTVSRPGGGSW
eukprot:scaffold229288_cov22-Tisochrysis_lutea.AAC.2